MLLFARKFSLWVFFLIPMISNNSYARSYIKIVGSSTLYPFTTIIAEEFGDITDFRTPVVEATGTGGGMKLFCSGIGEKYPDFTNASRAIKESEIERCKKNSISRPIEIKIGYDGIVLANSRGSNKISLTKKQIFLALAHKVPRNNKLINNPYNYWSDIDKSLPNVKIAVYGPPSTSGTRDAFVELVMEEPCLKIKEFTEEYPDKKKRKKSCHIMRFDGKFIEAGENDNLIVQKLKNDSEALGIFGFSFLQLNNNLIQGVEIDNIYPTFDSIIENKYKVSRPLLIYAKKEHIDKIAGMREFVDEIINEDTIGDEGYLVQRGLIPMSKSEYLRNKSIINNLF